MKVYSVYDSENPDNNYVAIDRQFWKEGFPFEVYGMFFTLIMEEKTAGTIEEMITILKDHEDNECMLTVEQYREFLLPVIEKGYLTLIGGGQNG